MLWLTADYWGNFKSDGKLFEELVGELLKKEYPNTVFDHVGGPYDGNKDFETQLSLLANKKENVWAECKYHTSNLSFSDISMTLLMAYIEDARQLLVFSYSPLTSNFHIRCNRYMNKTKIQINTYADCSLETLILRHKDKIPCFDAFFPIWPSNTTETTLNGEPICQYLVNGTSRKYNEDISHNIEIKLNDLFFLELHLFNPRDIALKIKVSIPSGDIDFRHLNFLTLNKHLSKNYIIDVEVPEHSGVMYEFPIRLRGYKQRVIFPPITISWEEQSRQIKLKQKVHCNWLAETPLIGNTYHSLLQKIRTQLNAQCFSISVISGRSGVGKSRILEEIFLLSPEIKLEVTRINARHKRLTCELFCQKLCASLTGLPFFETEKPKIKWTNSDNYFDLRYAAAILYSEAFDVHKELKKVARYFSNFLVTTNRLLILDDAQDYDESIYDLLDLILTYCIDGLGSSTIIFSVNNDYLYKGTRAEEFFQRLAYMDKQSSGLTCSCNEVVGFCHDDALQFVHECLSFDSAEVHNASDNLPYELVFEKIVSAFGANPFLLQTYLLYLEQEGALKRSSTTSFYVHNAEHFQNLLEEIPTNVTRLLHKREQCFLAQFFKDEKQIENYYTVIRLLVLTKCLPHVLLSHFDDISVMVERLIAIGLVSYTSDGDIVFFHSYIEKYYMEYYPSEIISQELLAHFCKVVDKLALQPRLFFPLFLARYFLGTVDEKLFSAALSRLETKNIELDFSESCMEAISLLLESGRFPVTITAYLNAYLRMIEMIGARKGIRKRFAFFQRIYDSFMFNPQTFKCHLPLTFSIFRKYLISLINIRQIQKSLDINFNLLKIYEDFEIDNIEKSRILIKLYNCQVMAYNQKNQLEEALDANSKSKTLLIEFEDYSELINTWRGRGDIYYSNANAYLYRSQFAESWLIAYKLFQTHYGSEKNIGFTNQLKVSTYLKAALANMALNHRNTIEEQMRFISACIGKTEMMYYEINARLVKVEYYLWKENVVLNRDIYSESIKLIDQATDIAALYGRQSGYINCFHLRAVLQLCNGEYDFAFDNFMKAAKMLVEALNSEDEYQHWKYFWFDLAIQSRRLGQSLPTELIQSVKCSNLLSKMRYIASMSHQSFDSFYKNEYLALSPLSDSSGKLALPRI